MHHIDLSDLQAGLPCSVFTPTFPIVRLGSKGSTSAIVTIGSPEPDLRLGEAESYALIVFNDGRHTTELMSTKNLLHKSHSNNEKPKKGIGRGTIFFEDASYTLQ